MFEIATGVHPASAETTIRFSAAARSKITSSAARCNPTERTCIAS
jgi:hypothetical protein